jgi:hypothetical protein
MEDERIETRWFALAELERLIRTGKLRDGKTILAVLAWKQFGRRAARMTGPGR